jgi:hypothetical protein
VQSDRKALSGLCDHDAGTIVSDPGQSFIRLLQTAPFLYQTYLALILLPERKNLKFGDADAQSYSNI